MEDRRRQLIDNIRIAIADKKSENDVLQSAVELIDSFSDDFSWTGFYMMRNGVLEVGPYVGPPTPHTKIELSNGICGAAARSKASVIVDDVRADERFLACSLSTRSEIVVPLMDGEKVLGEIDIDSDQPANFDQQDQQMLESVAELVVNRLKALG